VYRVFVVFGEEEGHLAAGDLLEDLPGDEAVLGGEGGAQVGLIIEVEFVDQAGGVAAVEMLLDAAGGFAAEAGHLFGMVEEGCPLGVEEVFVGGGVEEDDKFVHGVSVRADYTRGRGRSSFVRDASAGFGRLGIGGIIAPELP
jgi:hypothetical protein